MGAIRHLGASQSFSPLLRGALGILTDHELAQWCRPVHKELLPPIMLGGFLCVVVHRMLFVSPTHTLAPRPAVPRRCPALWKYDHCATATATPTATAAALLLILLLPPPPRLLPLVLLLLRLLSLILLLLLPLLYYYYYSYSYSYPYSYWAPLLTCTRDLCPTCTCRLCLTCTRTLETCAGPRLLVPAGCPETP